MTAEVSTSADRILDCLWPIWEPVAESQKTKIAHNAHSLAAIRTAVEAAGYAVCRVDLPDSISGIATSIDGTKFIVVNRAKSAAHQTYTVVHELAHHVLHLNPERPRLVNDGLEEFQAHMFAASWVFLATSDPDRPEVLRENPEASACLGAAALTSACVLGLALLTHLVANWSFRHPTEGSAR